MDGQVSIFDQDIWCGSWSVAWRVLDAQFWGTSDKPLPQRRRRIALVADFGGQSAPEILFVRKSLSRDTQPSQSQGKETSYDASKGTGADDIFCIDGDKLNKKERKGGSGIGYRDGDKQYTLTAKDVHGVAYCFEPGAAKRLGGYVWEGLAPTLRTEVGDNRPSVAYPVGDKRTTECVVYQDTVGALCARDYKGVGSKYVDEDKCVVAAVDCRNCTENSETNGTLQSHMSGGSSLNLNNVVRVKYIVRRLTPLECERLQGYPDGWTDIGEWVDSKGKVHKTSDAAQYKALGNSIALPPWKWVLKRLCACYERDVTMASLFDGIGGFTLIWEQINGKGTCLWASEIEEFPMAVTKKRIGG